MRSFSRLISCWRDPRSRLTLAFVVLPAALVAMRPYPPHATSRQASPRTESRGDSLALLRRINVPRIRSALRAVVSDSETFRRYWTPPRARGPIPEPAIDFSREIVILVALGRWPDTGAGIRIDSVVTGHTVAGLSTTVWVGFAVVGNECVVNPAITYPADAVVVPRNRHAALVQFREYLVVDSCPMTQWRGKLPKPRESENP